MVGTMRITVKPKPKESAQSFEDLLRDQIFTPDDVARLRAYTNHERRSRALYHFRRYLRAVSEDDLHTRIGYLIANVAYISERNRYSTNNLYSNYWRTKLAHAAEELAIRGATETVSSNVLQRLPGLGFATPQEPALKHDAKVGVLFRYDKLKHLRKLLTLGEIWLRCGSTSDPTNDFARNDPNELCIQLRLPADELNVDLSPEAPPLRHDVETFAFKIYQKTDFFMFCLSTAYDWRLFGDFSAGPSSADPEDAIACLVITDPSEFGRRFLSAAIRSLRDNHPELSHGFEMSARSACYYDPYDPDECVPLFDDPLLRPFAKRREYTYQHEFRYVIRPNLPSDFVPTYAPADTPKFQREFLYLGSLEDIAYIIPTSAGPSEQHPYYLSRKDIALFTSALGITVPGIGDRLRFTYCVEIKERGRSDPRNLIDAKRFGGGSSLKMSQQEIDITVPHGGAAILEAIRNFFYVFDIREQGNHLFGFEARLQSNGALMGEYRAGLPCAEPADDKIEDFPVTFEFQYTAIDGCDHEITGSELIAFDGHTYMQELNFGKPPQRSPTYRSLLLAEMEFIRRLVNKCVRRVVAYDCISRELGYRVSGFSASGSRHHATEPAAQA
jgi:hypothetical protein